MKGQECLLSQNSFRKASHVSSALEIMIIDSLMLGAQTQGWHGAQRMRHLPQAHTAWPTANTLPDSAPVTKDDVRETVSERLSESTSHDI